MNDVNYTAVYEVIYHHLLVFGVVLWCAAAVFIIALWHIDREEASDKSRKDKTEATPKIGRYRIRRGLFGRSVLQELVAVSICGYPLFLEASRSEDNAIRKIVPVWKDVKYKKIKDAEIMVKEEKSA